MPDADRALGDPRVSVLHRAPLYSLFRGALGIFLSEEGAMRFSENDTLARPAKEVSSNRRDGSDNTLSQTQNFDTCLKVEMLPPEALKAYSGNARTHSKKQIRQIAESIKQFG